MDLPSGYRGGTLRRPVDNRCDFFSYRVTGSYPVGTTKTVRTMEGAEAPAVL